MQKNLKPPLPRFSWIFLPMLTAILLAFYFWGTVSKKVYHIKRPQEIEYFLKAKKIRIIVFDRYGGTISGIFREPKEGKDFFKVQVRPSYADTLYDIARQIPTVKEVRITDPSFFESNMFGTLLIVFCIVVIFYVMARKRNKMMGGLGLSFGKSKARLHDKNNKQRKTFADVAGVDEAKEGLREIVEFLIDPHKFQKLGGRIPKGVLLMGPPGTGKTLLAQAVAGEAQVPFFSISGSEFVEMFVGVGASRVRDLFEQGKKNAPCLIFIDEIDAVGRHRGSGLGGGHDEREQTLNQLLVEMDGFDSNVGVILIASTNRPDVLDPALLRPGRFDRRIIVQMPDLRGREQILKIHTQQISLEENLDLSIIARGTPGFTGADLENLVNEAALNAARLNKETVTMADFEIAKDKVLMGAERRSVVLDDEEKKNIAYHESGHALVAMNMPHADPIHKVSIIPRGMTLGVTQMLPERDRHIQTREYLEDQIAVLMGGRTAEEIFLKTMTTGAHDDFEHATELARQMVCNFGMSEMGPLVFGRKQGPIFLGRDLVEEQNYSEATAERIDQTVKNIIDRQYEKAKEIIQKNKKALERLAQALQKHETLNAQQIQDIVNGVPFKS